MPSRIEIVSHDPDQTNTIEVDPGDHKVVPFTGNAYVPPPLVICHDLDISTTVYIPRALPGVIVPGIEDDELSVLMIDSAELYDGQKRVDLAELGADVAEGRIFLSHFSHVFGSN